MATQNHIAALKHSNYTINSFVQFPAQNLINNQESGVVQWLRVETHDREIRVLFPAPAVDSDLFVVCNSS